MWTDSAFGVIEMHQQRKFGRIAGTKFENPDLVGLAERSDPPVQCTRRVAARPVTIGGVTIPAGALVWVLLATADRGDPWPPATFGGGPHACPGRPAAISLARGVVGAVLDGGWRPVPGQAPGYEPRPNLRIPVSVLLERS